MQLQTQFKTITLEELLPTVQAYRQDSYRFVQILAVTVDDGVDLIYSFMKNAEMVNLKIESVKDTDEVESITFLYLSAFVFENEIHDLFGVTINNIAIDFQGNFYKLNVEKPMRIISAEKLAQKEKEAKLAAAKKAKEASKQSEANADAEFEAKLAAMDPAKAAKVRAAMEAKRAKEAAQRSASADVELEAKLAAMDPEKAAKVRAAMEAKRAKEAATQQKDGE